MRWTERQRAMLAEMGLRPWFRDDGATATGDGTVVEVVTAAKAVTAAAMPAAALASGTATATSAGLISLLRTIGQCLPCAPLPFERTCPVSNPGALRVSGEAASGSSGP